MFAERRAYLFLILVSDHSSALGLARLLSDLSRKAADVSANFLIPPVVGLRFFSDESVQGELDAWWAEVVRDEHTIVYLVDHEPGLPDWLDGIDGHLYVRVPSLEVTALYRSRFTTTFVSHHPLEYARLVMRDYSHDPAGVFVPQEAARMAILLSDPGRAATATRERGNERPRPQGITLHSSDSSRLASGHPPPRQAFQFLDHGAASTKAPLWKSQIRRIASGTSRISLRGSRRTEAPNQRLAQEMLRRGTTIVVMGSRKGGVGKTSCAAGAAIQAGQLLDRVSHTACLVDANIANPDAWGQMNLPVRAATVRQVVSALATNREPPTPIHAQTPALACYPESREASDYSKTDVDRLAAYLRRRYTFIVVDMSNRLPDPLGGPEAAVAAYWLDHADVVVLPTTSAVADFNGVLDYLEVADLPPVVVAYIVPRVRLNREHRVTRAYLEAIRLRVAQVVEVPDLADKVRLAGMEHVPVEQVSPALRNAYRRVTQAVINAPLRAHDRASLRDA